MKQQSKLTKTVIVISALSLGILLLPLNNKVRSLLPFDYPTYFSMVISAFTLLATVLVAYLIYSDQLHREREQHASETSKAKVLISSEIESAIENLILPEVEYKSNFVGKNIRDLFIHSSSVLNEALGQESFKHLSKVVNFIDAYANNDNEEARYFLELEGFNILFRDWVRALLYSKYRKYATLVYDYRELLSKRTIDLLRELQYGELKYDKGLTRIYSEVSGYVFSYNPTNKEYTVMDGDILVMQGSLSFDASTNQYRIKEGVDKDEHYSGFYSNGLFEGKGCLFNSRGMKSEEGEWRSGQLYSGKKYDNLLVKTRRNDDAVFGNAYDELDNLAAINPLVDASNVGSFYVTDFVIDKGEIKEKYNERTLLEFIRNEYRDDVWSINQIQK